MITSGFEDIEQDPRNLDGGAHKAMYVQKNFTDHTFDAKISYYSWAQEKAAKGNFKSKTDQFLWEYHAEGLSTRQISPRIGLEQSWTSRKIAKIRTYLQEMQESMASMSMQMAIG